MRTINIRTGIRDGISISYPSIAILKNPKSEYEKSKIKIQTNEKYRIDSSNKGSLLDEYNIYMYLWNPCG